MTSHPSHPSHPTDDEEYRSGRFKLNRADLAAMPDDRRRYELINGRMVVSPAPVPRHQRASGRIQLALAMYLNETRAGVLYNAPVDVVLTDHDVVEPDLLVILKGGRAVVGEKAIEGAPDLIVEVLSPSTELRDRRDKRQLYAQHGVREYWLCDVDAHRIERLTLNDGALTLAELLDEPATLRTPLLPRFELSLVELFAPERL